jgi:hypothetical protein
VNVALPITWLASGLALLLVGMPGALAQEVEPLGPSSRRTGIVMSELMYQPQGDPQERNLQFVELFNADLVEVDLGGFQLTGSEGLEFTFPDRTTVPAGGFLVLAPAPGDVESAYGLTGVVGGFSELPRNTGTLRLLNRAGAILLEVNYGNRHPWPEAADGAGPSLVLARPSLGEADPSAWSASQRVGGSPGFPEPTDQEPLRALCINEILANPLEGGQDYIELYNRSDLALDISGCIVTDSRSQDKFRFPDGTWLGPRGYRAVYREELGFGLSAAGIASTCVIRRRQESWMLSGSTDNERVSPWGAIPMALVDSRRWNRARPARPTRSGGSRR